MRRISLSMVPLLVAGIAAPALSLGGCGVAPSGSDAIGSKSQAYGVLPRKHHERIDEDGLFISYWERADSAGNYTIGGPGAVEMNTFANGYTTTVQFAGLSSSPWPNNVAGKGKRRCYGDIVDWETENVSNDVTIRVYGWLEDPLVEYYIGRDGDPAVVDYGRDMGSYDLAGDPNDTWTLYVKKMDQENILAPVAPGSKFLQYNVMPEDGQPTTEGPVDLGLHFQAWEDLMSDSYNDPNDATWWSGYTWNEFTLPYYCMVTSEIMGPTPAGSPPRTATVKNISITPSSAVMLDDGACNGEDDDNDGSVDEDWVTGSCILPHEATGFPGGFPGECGGQFGTTLCTTSGGETKEVCRPNVFNVPDVCDGKDNDCDGTVDEGVPEIACDGIDNDCNGVVDGLAEVRCNYIDDDCDGTVDEGSINLPIRCVWDDDDDGIENGLDPDPGTYSDDFVEPNYGSTGGTIVDRGDQTVVILDPFSDEGVWIETTPLGGSTPAQISLCGGTVNLTMGAGEIEIVTCPETSCLFASDELKMLDRAEVYSDFHAGSFTGQWDVEVFAHGESTGNGNLFERAFITGTATLAGALSGAGLVGDLIEGATVDEQALTEFPIHVPLGIPVTIPEGGTGTIGSGDWGDVVVEREASLAIAHAGTYKLKSLDIGPDSVLDLTAAGTDRVVLAVEGNANFGDALQILGNADFDIFVNGSSVIIGYDTPSFAADLEAPYAHVEVRDRTVYNGCLGGQNVTLGYDSEFRGTPSDAPTDPPDPGNGPGGSGLTFWQTTTNDWGGDYCIQVGANNPGATTDWIITINTNGSTIYDTWNANFSGTSGTVTADPNQSYNTVIDAGETDTTVGFCAHRNAPGQLATVVSVVAE